MWCGFLLPIVLCLPLYIEGNISAAGKDVLACFICVLMALGFAPLVYVWSVPGFFDEDDEQRQRNRSFRSRIMEFGCLLPGGILAPIRFVANLSETAATGLTAVIIALPLLGLLAHLFARVNAKLPPPPKAVHVELGGPTYPVYPSSSSTPAEPGTSPITPFVETPTASIYTDTYATAPTYSEEHVPAVLQAPSYAQSQQPPATTFFSPVQEHDVRLQERDQVELLSSPPPTNPSAPPAYSF